MGERHARFGFAGDRGIASGDSRQDLRKARPERISFTFRDDATGAVALDLATRRHWFAGTVSAVFFAIFLAVAVGSGQRITLHEAHDVFGFMMMLFDVFG